MRFMHASGFCFTCYTSMTETTVWQQLWTSDAPMCMCAGKPYEMCRRISGSGCWTSSHRSAWCTTPKLAAVVL